MYLCTVYGNSRALICTLSRAHWQQDSKRSALRRSESIWKDSDKCAYRYNINNNDNNNLIIIIVIIIILLFLIIIN